MTMRTRTSRWTVVVLLLAVGISPGCVWLQNEFFVYDVAPPPLVDDAGATDRVD